MKALAVDSATNRLTVAARNEDKYFSAVFDIGMHQSQTLVPAINYVLTQVGLTPSELEFSTLCIGPGSFTGLRIAISALKAIELSNNVPVYGVSSLKTYAEPFFDLDIPVIGCVDAKKDKFYAALFEKSVQTVEDGDWEINEIAEKIKQFDKVFIAGPEAALLKELLEKEENCKKTNFIIAKSQVDSGETLLRITEKMISENVKPLQDYDGPVYLRASEAEIKLNQ